MKKIATIAIAALLLCTTLLTFVACTPNTDDDPDIDTSKLIKVCASDVPHAEVLNGIVKQELAKQGYELAVTILDWTLQNDSVAKGDYDANYFQHVPYLQTYTGSVQLFATCKVHYEPLGIYYGKSNSKTLAEGKKFAICDDVSNAIRAFQLLEDKGVISKDVEKENYPVNSDGDELTFSGTEWKNSAKTLTVKLIPENTLVFARADYDFVLLPCNTAYTGNVPSGERIAVEDDPDEVILKANIIAARLNDYKNDEVYQAKIDALTEVMLSQAVADYFAQQYLGAITCDQSTQIDLRQEI